MGKTVCQVNIVNGGDRVFTGFVVLSVCLSVFAQRLDVITSSADCVLSLTSLAPVLVMRVARSR